MKLLLLCATPEYTGPAELMLDDAVTLQAEGHEVAVAFDTLRPGSLRERVEAAGLRIEESLGLSRKGSPLSFARDVARLRRLVEEERYDTLHVRFSHDHHAALLALAGIERAGVRLIRSCELLHNAAPGAGRSLVYAGTDRFAVPSAEHAAALVENHGIAAGRIDRLPGRVDAERFRPGPSPLRAELGIPADAPVVGIVSRIKPDRRHPDLLAAFARALGKVPDARLVIVGRGEGEPEVRALVERMGLGGSVHFAGYRTGAALAEAYRAFDVKAWIAPGNDGTCRAVLEAMASGCAVLGGRFGAVADAVIDGETGRLCDPDDVGATGEALAWLLADRARARILGEAGRRRVLACYTPAGRADALRELYGRAWAEGPRRPSHLM